MMDRIKINNLGALKASSYKSRGVKDEMRENLIRKMKAGELQFEGIHGFESTVIPDLERAVLSRHNIILLGLRGQAKTRIARLMTNLLDPWIPVISGSEINDDPLRPISKFGQDLIGEMGDDTPVSWIHRHERYTEKLATPDVSVADLIGDVDPIKAANLKLDYANERIIHFGLIPRSHRGIFVINELPDLQARIQVALFNILQEGDIQIRGFKLRLPLQMQFVFTANPEDYTNRGSIITPLKDRIESQILTHYPPDIRTARIITEQEAGITDTQNKQVYVHELARDLIEQLAFEARESEYIDEKSGVSARLPISALENLYSAAERRMLLAGDGSTTVRLSDFFGIIPSITGKVELVYEGEQEGPLTVALSLMSMAIRTLFSSHFPDPRSAGKSDKPDPYRPIIEFFSNGGAIELPANLSEKAYQKALHSVPGLAVLVDALFADASKKDKAFLMEFALHGLAEHNQISKELLQDSTRFTDLLSDMLLEDLESGI